MGSASSQNKCKDGEHYDVNNTNDRQDVGPANAARASVELSRAKTTNPTDFVRVPAERVDDAAEKEQDA